MLLTFINKARSQLKTTSNYVFLSYYGKPIEGGDVSKRLFHRWSQAGIFEGKTIPKNLTVNILRKSASTGIRENNPEKVQQTCDTMCHTANTAAEHYLAKAEGIVCLLWKSSYSQLFHSELKFFKNIYILYTDILIRKTFAYLLKVTYIVYESIRF